MDTNNIEIEEDSQFGVRTKKRKVLFAIGRLLTLPTAILLFPLAFIDWFEDFVCKHANHYFEEIKAEIRYLRY